MSNTRNVVIYGTAMTVVSSDTATSYIRTADDLVVMTYNNELGLISACGVNTRIEVVEDKHGLNCRIGRSHFGMNTQNLSVFLDAVCLNLLERSLIVLRPPTVFNREKVYALMFDFGGRVLVFHTAENPSLRNAAQHNAYQVVSLASLIIEVPTNPIKDRYGIAQVEKLLTLAQIREEVESYLAKDRASDLDLKGALDPDLIFDDKYALTTAEGIKQSLNDVAKRIEDYMTLAQRAAQTRRTT